MKSFPGEESLPAFTPSENVSTVSTAHCIVAIREERRSASFSHRNINLSVHPGDSLDRGLVLRVHTLLSRLEWYEFFVHR